MGTCLCLIAVGRESLGFKEILGCFCTFLKIRDAEVQLK